MKRRSVVTALVVLMLTGCGGTGVTTEASGLDRGSPHQAATAYSQMISAMAKADAGDRSAAAKLGLNLQAYNWTRDVSVGGATRLDADANKHAVIVSQQFESHVFLFSATGETLSHIPASGEVQSIQLYDFDRDGQDEIVTIQKTASGTGLYREEFIIYGVSAAETLAELWRATSVWRADPLDDPARAEEEEAFIKPGDKTLLFVLRRVVSGRETYERTELRYRDGRFARSN